MDREDFTFSESEQNTLKKLPIAALILFGSRAQGRARKDSDFDIGVLVSETMLLDDLKRRKELYDTLYDILSSHINQLVDIDIVFLERAPAELQAHVVKHGVVIFESQPSSFASFKEHVMINYADFEPLREIFHQGILSQIQS